MLEIVLVVVAVGFGYYVGRWQTSREFLQHYETVQQEIDEITERVNALQGRNQSPYVITSSLN